MHSVEYIKAAQVINHKLLDLRFHNPKDETYFQAMRKIESGVPIEDLFVSDLLPGIRVGTLTEFLQMAYQQSDTLSSSALQDEVYASLILLAEFVQKAH